MIELTQFEYDYLAAQMDVDTQKIHMDSMIRKGYFKNLAPYFVHEDCGTSSRHPDGKLHYVLIGTIREHIDEFVIVDGLSANAEDFKPSEYITTHSDREIVKQCISMMHSLTDSFAEYLDLIDADTDELIPFVERFKITEIVRQLLLFGTTHCGGTSTAKKCREMGIDTDLDIVFSTEEQEDEL